MPHNNQNPSNATLAGFSAGYRIADATLNAADKVAGSTKEAAVKVAGSTKDAAVATGHTVVGFFSGLRYAVAARRGTKVVEPKKAKKVEDPETKRREREELWRRVHGVQSEVATSRRTKTSGRAVRRAK